MKKRFSKGQRDLITIAKKLGYSVEERSSNHLCFRHPNPRVPLVFAAATPSDYHSGKNAAASLRQFVRLAEGAA